MTLLLTNQPTIHTFHAGVHKSLFYASGYQQLSLGTTSKSSEQNRDLHWNQKRSDYFLRPCSTPQGKGRTYIWSFNVIIGTDDLVIHSKKETVPHILCLYRGLVVTAAKAAALRVAFYRLQDNFTRVFSGVPQGEKKTCNLSELTIPILQIRKECKKL